MRTRTDRRLPLVTASAIDALWLCAYRFRPDVPKAADRPGVGALTGTMFHGLVEHALDGLDPRTRPAVPGADATRAWRMFERWQDWWGAWNPGFGWVSERPYAISLSTGAGRFRADSTGQRDYRWCDPVDEVPGTVDAVAVVDGVVHAVDWKTGDPRYVSSARDSRQLRTLALAAMRAHRAEAAIVTVVSVSEFAEPVPDSHEIDVLDADVHEDELRARVAAIHTSEPSPGTHCRFCRVIDCAARPAGYARPKVA